MQQNLSRRSPVAFLVAGQTAKKHPKKQISNKAAQSPRKQYLDEGTIFTAQTMTLDTYMPSSNNQMNTGKQAIAGREKGIVGEKIQQPLSDQTMMRDGKILTIARDQFKPRNTVVLPGSLGITSEFKEPQRTQTANLSNFMRVKSQERPHHLAHQDETNLSDNSSQIHHKQKGQFFNSKQACQEYDANTRTAARNGNNSNCGAPDVDMDFQEDQINYAELVNKKAQKSQIGQDYQQSLDQENITITNSKLKKGMKNHRYDQNFSKGKKELLSKTAGMNVIYKVQSSQQQKNTITVNRKGHTVPTTSRSVMREQQKSHEQTRIPANRLISSSSRERFGVRKLSSNPLKIRANFITETGVRQTANQVKTKNNPSSTDKKLVQKQEGKNNKPQKNTTNKLTNQLQEALFIASFDSATNQDELCSMNQLYQSSAGASQELKQLQVQQPLRRQTSNSLTSNFQLNGQNLAMLSSAQYIKQRRQQESAQERRPIEVKNFLSERYINDEDSQANSHAVNRQKFQLRQANGALPFKTSVTNKINIEIRMDGLGRFTPDMNTIAQKLSGKQEHKSTNDFLDKLGANRNGKISSSLAKGSKERAMVEEAALVGGVAFKKSTQKSTNSTVKQDIFNNDMNSFLKQQQQSQLQQSSQQQYDHYYKQQTQLQHQQHHKIDEQYPDNGDGDSSELRSITPKSSKKNTNQYNANTNPAMVVTDVQIRRASKQKLAVFSKDQGVLIPTSTSRERSNINNHLLLKQDQEQQDEGECQYQQYIQGDKRAKSMMSQIETQNIIGNPRTQTITGTNTAEVDTAKTNIKVVHQGQSVVNKSPALRLSDSEIPKKKQYPFSNNKLGCSYDGPKTDQEMQVLISRVTNFKDKNKKHASPTGQNEDLISADIWDKQGESKVYKLTKVSRLVDKENPYSPRSPKITHANAKKRDDQGLQQLNFHVFSPMQKEEKQKQLDHNRGLTAAIHNTDSTEFDLQQSIEVINYKSVAGAATKQEKKRVGPPPYFEVIGQNAAIQQQNNSFFPVAVRRQIHQGKLNQSQEEPNFYSFVSPKTAVFKSALGRGGPLDSNRSKDKRDVSCLCSMNQSHDTIVRKDNNNLNSNDLRSSKVVEYFCSEAATAQQSARDLIKVVSSAKESSADDGQPTRKRSILSRVGPLTPTEQPVNNGGIQQFIDLEPRKKINTNISLVSPSSDNRTQRKIVQASDLVVQQKPKQNNKPRDGRATQQDFPIKLSDVLPRVYGGASSLSKHTPQPSHKGPALTLSKTPHQFTSEKNPLKNQILANQNHKPHREGQRKTPDMPSRHDLLKESILGLRPRKVSDRNKNHAKSRPFNNSQGNQDESLKARDSLLIRVKQQIADTRALTSNKHQQQQDYGSPHCAKSLQPIRVANQVATQISL